jgi:ketosteroid isomerase-like protein
MSGKRVTPVVALLLTLAAACAPADDAGVEDMPAADTGAAATPAPPAELEAAGDAFTSAWNQEDPAVVAGMFTEGATVVVDDTATFNGRQEIQENWIAPGLGMVSDLEVQDQVWTADGADYRSSGRVSHIATTPEGEVAVTGRYESVWTRDTDGQWRVSSLRVNNDPATTTGQ